MAVPHLRHAARKLAGGQQMPAAVRLRLLPRRIHTDEANHRSKFAARGREEEALTAIEDKKVELYGMITKARSNEHRIGWRNRGLLWYLSSTPRPHDLKRPNVRPYKIESTFSKLAWFTMTTAILLLLGRSPEESKEAPGEDELQ